MKIKRICFFTTRCDYGRQAVIDHYEKVFPKDIKLFLFIRRDSPGGLNLKTHRMSITEVSCSKFLVLHSLRKFCKRNKIDLLVNLSGGVEVSFTLIFSVIFSKIKTIYYEMGDEGPEKIKNWLFLIAQFFISRILAGSKSEAKKLKKYLFFSKKKIFYLPHSIDIKKFKLKNKKSVRKKLGFKQNDKLIIYVGRIELMKGSDYLLEIIKKNPDKKFILLGKILDKNYKKENLKNTLIRIAEHDKIVDYYNTADLCLFLTKKDGYSYIPRESLASGTPVILSNINAFKPINTKGAIKVPFNIKVIQKQIDVFFSLSKKEQEKLGKQGRNFVIKDSSEEAVKPSVLKYFLKF